MKRNIGILPLEQLEQAADGDWQRSEGNASREQLQELGCSSWAESGAVSDTPTAPVTLKACIR